jgi:hypothetical protein
MQKLNESISIADYLHGATSTNPKNKKQKTNQSSGREAPEDEESCLGSLGKKSGSVTVINT